MPVSMMWALKVTRSTMADDEAGVGDDLAPFAERKIRCQSDRGLLFAFGEDLKQQLGAAGVELDVAEFVEADQVESAVAGDEARQASFVGGFGEFVDELGGGDVADSESLFAGGETEPDEQMGFAGSGIAEQHDGVTGVDVAAGGEGGDLTAGSTVGAASRSKSPSRLMRGKLGVVDAPGCVVVRCGRRLRLRGVSAKNPR